MPLTTRTDAVALPFWAAPSLQFTPRRAARVLLIVLAMLFSPVLGALAEETSFQAVVAQDKVDVRAGNSNQFYVVGTLERGARVTVVDIIGGWNLIVPPPGVSSFIAKSDVTADGKSGTVKSEKAMVRVLGPKGANPVESYKPHATLKKGETVNILSESGDYYIIEPPPGATVYLAPGTVRHADNAPAVAAAPARVEPKPAPAAPAPKPAAPAHVEPAKPKPVIEAKPEAGVTDDAAAGAISVSAGASAPEAVKGGSAPKPEAEPVAVVEMGPTTKPAKPAKAAKPKPENTSDESAAAHEEKEKPASRGAVFVPIVRAQAKAAEDSAATQPESHSTLGDSAAVRELETKLAAAAKQPIEKRPLAELLAGYEKASESTDLSPTDRKIVSVRIGQIRDNITLQKAIADAESIRKENSKPIALPPPPARPKAGVYNPADYDAVGQLLASTVYDGDASPRLFRIADPANQRTVAYVLPGPKIDVQQLLGRIVGVKGESKYDPALKLRVITVDKVDLLQVDTEPAK